MSTSCPCGSKKPFKYCCGQYISGKSLPETPEALMRSRYTAYTKANIQYIQDTMRGPAAEGFNPAEARAWAKSAQWKGLTVVNSHMETDTKGFVEFIARYRTNQEDQEIRENSEFHYIDGRWYYIRGV